MKKTFLVLLISAVAVWGYVVYRVVALSGGGSGGTGRTDPSPAAAIALLSRPRLALDTSFRDPFQPYLYARRPAPPTLKAAPARAVLKLIEPPRAVLTGVLWGEDPVAILKQDGKTELVKKGGTAWDLTVLKIDRGSVTVQKQGRSFTLEF